MTSHRMIFALAAATLALGGCSKEPAAEDVPMTVHEAMTQHIDVIADEVWAVGNAAMASDALIDPKLMDDAKWAKLADAAARLQNAATEMSMLKKLVVNRPGVIISDENIEGGTTSEQVQKNIDADPEGFRGMAGALASHMGDIAAAAKAHDAQRAGALVGQIDGVCENCHLEFWYPQQKDLVKQIMAEGDGAAARK
ncbi:cytochrome c [Altererythrobacter sp. CC-YST694]|uniref:cytochrome c n=1 Tax=Altererythrobacter sp. CC-YST694 TaxID=2755038 RepID=UPI001D0082E0|nr:cytochrome c [Altererythrobacter sp. CC-YST694]MCB5426604.1 cytochrome c [Altererythrobacter sp. CC-YST694]